MYIICEVIPHNSSAHLAPCTVITILLTIFPVLYVPSPWLFCANQFVLFKPFIFFTQSPNPPPIWQLSVCSLYLWVHFCFVCFLYLWVCLNSTYKWNHMAFFFLWVTSPSIIPFGYVHFVTNDKIFLWPSNIPFYICTFSLSTHLLMDT